jgi:broad specificity phosphatase PhoE
MKRHTATNLSILFAAVVIMEDCTSLARAQAPSDSVPLIILVRHAEKACAFADDPSLSQAGEKRAGDLAVVLGGAKVSHIITTDFRRTNETAKPLAQTLGLHPVVINLKENLTNINSHIGRVVEAIRASDNGTVLVVGHTITIPDIIARLGGPNIGKISESEYSNLFVLVGDSEKRLVRSRFGAADDNPQLGCN